jgi:NAD(P)-dependent dehydrogenase (short-subunit alcohol dehydrogenase family)
VVSGGGTGIGYAVARAFATDGGDVWIIGRRTEVLRAAGIAAVLRLLASPEAGYLTG